MSQGFLSQKKLCLLSFLCHNQYWYKKCQGNKLDESSSMPSN